MKKVGLDLPPITVSQSEMAGKGRDLFHNGTNRAISGQGNEVERGSLRPSPCAPQPHYQEVQKNMPNPGLSLGQT